MTMIGPGLPHDRPPLSKRVAPDRARAAARRRGAARGARDRARRRSRDRLRPRPPSTRWSAPRAAARRSTSRRRQLVWATGLRYPRPPVPGFEQAEENATGAGLDLSRTGVWAVPGRRVVVVGAGLIGTETAATLAAAHDVTLVDMLDRPLARLAPASVRGRPRRSRRARRALSRLVQHRLCDRRQAAGTVVHTSTHGDIGCDVLVSAAGFRSSLLPELAGSDARALTLDADEQLRVLGHERLWACGDCVSFPHPRWGRIAIPHWDHALWSGRHVADSILGSPEPYVREPYFFSDIGSLRIQQVGVADAPPSSGPRTTGSRSVSTPQARPRASSCSTPRLACARLVSFSRARPAPLVTIHIVGGTSCPYA